MGSSKAETSAIKVTFNDEENFEQMDLSGLIKNLENESMEQEEFRKSMERRENDQKLLEKEEEPNKALNAEENKVIDKGLEREEKGRGEKGEEKEVDSNKFQ